MDNFPKDMPKLLAKDQWKLQVKLLFPHGFLVQAGGPWQVALEIQGMTHLPSHDDQGPRWGTAVGEISELQVQFFNLERVTLWSKLKSLFWAILKIERPS